MRVEDRAAAAAVGGGGIVDKLVSHDVAQMAIGCRGADQGQRRQFVGRVLIIVAEGETFVNRRRRFRDHSKHPHGIADHGHQFPRRRGALGQRQRLQLVYPRHGLNLQHRQVSFLGQSQRCDVHRRRKTGKEGEQFFELGGGSLLDQVARFRISVPGLSHVAVGSEQSVGDHETAARDAGAQKRSLPREADAVDAKDVADRIAVAIEDHGRHGLLLLQLLDLVRQLLYLQLEIRRRPGRIVVVGDEAKGKQ